MSDVRRATSGEAASLVSFPNFHNIREFKHDVYGRRQTAKITSEFVFFSSNPELNRIKIEKCLLQVTANANISTLLYRQLKTDGKSFIIAVCRLA